MSNSFGSVCVLPLGQGTQDKPWPALCAPKGHQSPATSKPLLSLPGEIRLCSGKCLICPGVGVENPLIPLRQKESIAYFSTLNFFLPKVVLVDHRPFQRDIAI